MTTKNREIKIKKRHEDYGFGFKVVFINVPEMKRLGHWCLEVNWKEVAERLFEAMASKPGRLTGNELRFIRKHRRMTFEQFARRFAVTHPAVMKWEKAGDQPTGMGWATEKDIRLAILDWCGCKPRAFKEAYAKLAEPAAKRPRVFKYDCERGTLAA